MAEEKIQEEEIKNEEAEKQGEAQESPQEDLNQKISELNDKYLRLYSEFENFRRRTAKEKLEIIGNANEKLLNDLLPVIDDFERALESNKNV